MPIGTRRKGTFVRYNLRIPTALLDRAMSFYTLPGAQRRKTIYGFQSQLCTQLLTEWANSTDTSYTGTGTRRHNSPAQTRVFINVPQQLADKIAQLAPASNGPIFGFRSQLLTLLLERWVAEREENLRLLPSTQQIAEGDTALA